MTREIELIGVPFDGYGRAGNQARAAQALRDAGLASVLGDRVVIVGPSLELPPAEQGRGDQTSLINEPALVALTAWLRERVRKAIDRGRFPLVYGGDCSSLLGIVAGLNASAVGRHGLLFIDGHEDTMPLDVSEDGEAANSEIGLLLGLTGHLMSGPLAEQVPALERDQLTVLGPRDEEWRRQFNVGSLRDLGVWFRSWREVAADPAGVAREAVNHLQRTSPRWWLHVDLDVLSPDEFFAQGLPDVEDTPGGLTWAQLSELLTTAVEAPGSSGWSIAIYDPDQDPDGSDAAAVIRLVERVLASRRPEPDGR